MAASARTALLASKGIAPLIRRRAEANRGGRPRKWVRLPQEEITDLLRDLIDETPDSLKRAEKMLDLIEDGSAEEHYRDIDGERGNANDG